MWYHTYRKQTKTLVKQTFFWRKKIMKMHLLNPFLRHISTFFYRPIGYEVIPKDNRFIYINDGSISIRMTGRVFILKKNDILYSPSGIPYEFFSSNEDEGSAIITSVNFDLTYDDYKDIKPRIPMRYTENSKAKKEKHINDFLCDKSFLTAPCVFNHAKQYYYFFSKMINEYHGTNEYARDLCSCVLKELIINLHTFTESVNDPGTIALETVTEYIVNNYKKKLDNKLLANLVGYHPNYLGRLFKRNFNCGIQQYILNIRISEAKKLIAESELPLSEISYLCGFNDYHYFSDYFKKRTGINPSQYRTQCKTIV